MVMVINDDPGSTRTNDPVFCIEELSPLTNKTMNMNIRRNIKQIYLDEDNLI